MRSIGSRIARRLRLLPLLALGLAPGPGIAQTMSLPAESQIPLLLKVLTYDRRFEAKAGTEVVVGIVYMAGDPDSLRAAEEVGTIFYKFAGKTVKKLPVKYVMVEYTRAPEVERLLKAKGIKVLYVTPGNSKNLEDLVKMSQANGLTSATGVPDYVKKGIAVGVGLRADRKPQIYINLPSSKSEGSEFDASLLQIAEVQK
jgi:hypothetical protein